jgi:hypothetical protein
MPPTIFSVVGAVGDRVNAAIVAVRICIGGIVAAVAGSRIPDP